MDEEYVLDPLTQEELNEIAQKHHKFMTAQSGGARANIKDRDLSGLSMAGMRFDQADFTGCVMRNVDMTGINFESATLFGCDFSYSQMKNGNFARADLRGADIQHADLTDANLSGADLRLGSSIIRRKMKKPEDQYGKASAGHVTFNGTIMQNVNLQNVTAIGADFSDAILEHADFFKADIRDSNFRGANLQNVNMDECDMRNADFHAATMMGATMEGVERAGTKFDYTLMNESDTADFSEVELTVDELIDKHTQWVASAGQNGERMDLSKFDMRKIRSLAGKKLTAIVARGTVFADMNLQSVDIQSAKLDDANFRECDMRHIDMRGSSLKHAIFIRADMSSSNCGPLIFNKGQEDEKILSCNFEDAILRYTLCKDGDFRYANFKGADLTHTDFTGADLRNANFDGAILDEVILEDAQLKGAYFDRERGEKFLEKSREDS